MTCQISLKKRCSVFSVNKKKQKGARETCRHCKYGDQPSPAAAFPHCVSA